MLENYMLTGCHPKACHPAHTIEPDNNKRRPMLLIRLLCLALLLGRSFANRLEYALFGLKAIAQTVRDHRAG